jgi:hypothetical protein
MSGLRCRSPDKLAEFFQISRGVMQALGKIETGSSFYK